MSRCVVLWARLVASEETERQRREDEVIKLLPEVAGVKGSAKLGDCLITQYGELLRLWPDQKPKDALLLALEMALGI